MLTATHVGYKLPARKLLLAYLAVVPLLAFALMELQWHIEGGRVTWLSAAVVVFYLVAAVELLRKWVRFVKQMDCSEIGIHVDTLVAGDHDIAWGRILRLRNVDSGGFTGLVSIEVNASSPFYLWLDGQTCMSLIALLREQSEAEIAGFPNHLTDG